MCRHLTTENVCRPLASCFRCFWQKITRVEFLSFAYCTFWFYDFWNPCDRLILRCCHQLQVTMTYCTTGNLTKIPSSPNSFIWQIEEFSTVSGLISPEETFQSEEYPDYDFDLLLNPKFSIETDIDEELETYVSVMPRRFVYLVSSLETVPDKQTIQFRIAIVNASGEHCFVRGIQSHLGILYTHRFHCTFVFPDFIADFGKTARSSPINNGQYLINQKYLLDPDNNLLVNDTLKVCCEVWWLVSRASDHSPGLLTFTFCLSD